MSFAQDHHGSNADRHESGRDLVDHGMNADQLAFLGFGATYRDELLRVERGRYAARKSLRESAEAP